MRLAIACIVGTISILATLPSAAAVTIDTVFVGDPNKTRDPATGSHFGAVGHECDIGMFEVTNNQYVAFLNQKAQSDPLRLYNPRMGSNARGGISQDGASGSFTYSVKPDMGNKPVNYVSWYDAIRFANWLNNGQGNGDTETGTYTLGALGANGVPLAGSNIARNPNATWFLPTENEWYKAAYYQPASLGGDVDGYWLYPTASNNVPTMATSINTAGPTRGDIANPGANVANYAAGATWNNQIGNLTSVGSAGPLSRSYYGTYDQGGNAFEWTKTLLEGTGGARVARGGSWGFDADAMRSSDQNYEYPEIEDEDFSSILGFRVATVPEPSSLALAIFGLAGLATWGWRRRSR